jgi:hypothetical protein
VSNEQVGQPTPCFVLRITLADLVRITLADPAAITLADPAPITPPGL